ncbi:hypothetical protein AB6A40_000121 [Gnathostoma spinigerum]|uniref:Protein quiver n=1 Tax=Gnathostoma spinigerum TaxID=75299 RepID=A0ABD6E9Q7_9BILA
MFLPLIFCTSVFCNLYSNFFFASASIRRKTTEEPQTRLKGQIACYACIAYTRDVLEQRIHYDMSVSNNTLLALYDVLRKLQGGLIIPRYSEKCIETHTGMDPDFEGTSLAICSNNNSDPGACVKLKGRYRGATYVLRQCWGLLWKDARRYSRSISQQCIEDERVQDFVETERNTICFCEDDLCNGSLSLCLYLAYCAFLVFAHIQR